MNLYFGIVNEYSTEKGYGFLTHPIYLGPEKKVFFHISNVKRSNAEFAKRLSNYKEKDEIAFWYTTESTNKGEKLQWIINSIDANKHYNNHLPNAYEKIEALWTNTETTFPFWFDEATIGLFGVNLTEQLKRLKSELNQKTKDEWESKLKEVDFIKIIWDEKLEIENQKNIVQRELDELRMRIKKHKERFLKNLQEKKEEEELRTKMKEKAEENKKIADEIIRTENIKANEEQRNKAQIEDILLSNKGTQKENKNYQEINIKFNDIERNEFELLVAEVQSKGFMKSAEVSNYIVRNRLGEKYQNISGILEMKNSHSSWEFNGGFPPIIYKMLCNRLNLGNNETDSKVVGFKSYKVLKDTNEEK
jgi:hypothetical protein